jgi:hypothetical protein
MGLGPLAPLFLRNGELLGHSPIHNVLYYLIISFSPAVQSIKYLYETVIRVKNKVILFTLLNSQIRKSQTITFQ